MSVNGVPSIARSLRHCAHPLANGSTTFGQFRAAGPTTICQEPKGTKRDGAAGQQKRGTVPAVVEQHEPRPAAPWYSAEILSVLWDA
jgi:hypothetical protein